MPRNRTRLLIAMLMAAGGLVAFLAVFRATTEDVFSHDFRGQSLPSAVRLTGPQVGKFARVEAEGLRITLPRDRKDVAAQVGFSIPLNVRGDFEITADVELLHADVPPTGY